jgi:energy-coupling factor transport system substrate-specific component
VYVGKGLGFDAVHAVGCLLFALAFGPALARTIARFAARLEVRWEPVVPLILVGLLAFGATGPARAGSTPISYLLSAQNTDGGFGPGPGEPSTELYSGWAALGLESAGYAPGHVARRGRSLLNYLRKGAAGASDPGSLERTILAAAAGAASPARFGGRDLVAALERDVAPSGAVSDQTNLTAFAVLALRAAGVPPPRRTLAWLIRQQDQDGGFNFATAGGGSDVDDTGAALEALAGAPGAARATSRAVRFVRASQARDGGFPSMPGAGSNAQSTAWAVQGLVAAGVDPSALHRGGAPSPLAYLNSLVAGDGHVRYSRASDQTPVWVTAEAMMALAGKPLPLRPLQRPHKAVRSHRFSARAASHRKTVRRHRARAASRRRPAAEPISSSMTLRLATDAGILEAVALAPIGVG